MAAAPGVLARAGAAFFHSEIAGRLFTNAWYSLVNRLDRRAEATLMNYGYAGAETATLELDSRLEPHRYGVGLYHHVASRVPIEGKDVLEVGCGRAGGASYVAQAFRPRRYVGLDVNRSTIRFDRRFYAPVRNLAFVAGDAHALPFADGSFDVALNVESSHHYRDIARFLAEVRRVLVPGGTFVMTCFPREDEPSTLRDRVRDAGFDDVAEEDITAAVVRALELDAARRDADVRRLAPAPLRTFAREFAGTRDSQLFDSFASGRRRYLTFVLRTRA